MCLIQGHYSADFGVLLHEYSKANVEKRTGCIRGNAGAGEVDDCQLRRLDLSISTGLMFSNLLVSYLGCPVGACTVGDGDFLFL